MVSAFEQTLAPLLYGIHVAACELAFSRPTGMPKDYRKMANIRDLAVNTLCVGVGVSQLLNRDMSGLVLAYGVPQATILGHSRKVQNLMVSGMENFFDGSSLILHGVYEKIKSTMSSADKMVASYKLKI